MTGLPETAFTTPQASAATGEQAWLSAMLEVERALASAAAQVGVVRPENAQAVVDACDEGALDADAIRAAVVSDATPVVELVRQLRARVPEDAQEAVHVAATSQDVVDTAMVLVCRRAIDGVVADAAVVTDLLARLAQRHRDDVQTGRTLLQDGAVTTFGALAASRLVAVDDALDTLQAVVRDRLCLQLGGAVGTLAPVKDVAAEYLTAVAHRLGLPEPVTPWHTSRGRVAQLVSACAVLTGELAAVAHDVVLLSQSSVAEVTVAHPGGSSAMPHKRNPASAVLVLACARRTPGLVATVLSGMPQELQRSAGSWQAEWAVVSEVLRLVAAAAAHTRRTLDGLVVDTGRMARNAEALGSPLDAGAAGLVVDRALTAHHERRAARPTTTGDAMTVETR
ncbi:MAG TPA: lyase family protein [Actinomycetales bacterium]|nr:lyase family protein [Actinomycetales bacterium]